LQAIQGSSHFSKISNIITGTGELFRPDNTPPDLKESHEQVLTEKSQLLPIVTKNKYGRQQCTEI
jgi:hypothetical protein